MVRPTDTLRTDHVAARQALRVLRGIAMSQRQGQHFPAADCALLLRFLREFLVGVHWKKESEVVWPALAMRGDEQAAESVGELFRLQEEFTELLHSLVLFWEPADLSPLERAGFADTALALTARLERMLALEETELFAACDAAVPPDDQLDWLAQFASCEQGRSAVRDWQPQLAKLAERWAPGV
jgi:hemerythrin-like domain-containing protein